MKIAFISPADFSRYCAGRTIAYELYKYISKSKHEMHVLAPHPTKKTQVKIKNIHYFGDVISVKANQSTNDLNYGKFEDHQKLKELLDSENFDIVIYNEPVNPFLNWAVLDLSKTTNVGWFHSTTNIDLEEFPYKVVTKPLELWLKDKLDGVIAVSPSVKENWKIVFRYNGVIIPVGVDIERFKNAKQIQLSKLKKILFVGRLDKRKGVTHAIKSFNEILKGGIEAKLFIVGEGQYRKKAEILVDEYGIGGLVEFRGKVDDDDLPSYYKSCDVYIAPSIGSESLGIVILEAMAAGIPVVAYANKGYRFTLEGSPWKGNLVKPGSYKKMANSVQQILTDEKLRTSVLKWQNNKIKEFDWKVITDRLLTYFSEVQDRKTK